MRILSVCVVLAVMTTGCLDSGGDGGSSGASGAGAGGTGGTAGASGTGGVGGTSGVGGVGGTGGVGGGSGTVCEQGANKLRGCGLATEGVFSSCSEPMGAGEECESDCLLNADCVDLEAFFCATQQTAALAACLSACPESPQFTCVNGEMVPQDWHCDGFDDCADGTDEDGCTDMFSCGSGEQVPASWECDGEEDCADGSDEVSCPTELTLICN